MRNLLVIALISCYVLCISTISIGQVSDTIEVKVIDQFTTDDQSEYEIHMLAPQSLDSNYTGKSMMGSFWAKTCEYSFVPVCKSEDSVKLDVYCEYKNGRKIKSESFYPNGKIRETVHFNEQGMDGEHSIKFQNGNLERLEYYSNGKQLSPVLKYYNSGAIRYISFASTDLAWSSMSFYEKGNIFSEFVFEDPESMKARDAFYGLHGNLQFMTILNDGIQPYFELNGTGDTLISGKIDNVEFLKVGVWKYYWYEQGCLKLAARYSDTIPNQRVGTWKYYNQGCKLIKEEIYEGGELKETKEYSPINLGKKD